MARHGGVSVLVVLVGLVGGGLLLHQRANAAPVSPVWRQPIVTIDHRQTVAAARQWPTPFEVRYADEADIHVSVHPLDGLAAGEAAITVDGGRISGCAITVKPQHATNPVVLAHEAGHCFGLSHDNEHKHSLMYWIQGGSSGASGVTDHDRAALKDLYE